MFPCPAGNRRSADFGNETRALDLVDRAQTVLQTRDKQVDITLLYWCSKRARTRAKHGLQLATNTCPGRLRPRIEIAICAQDTGLACLAIRDLAVDGCTFANFQSSQKLIQNKWSAFELAPTMKRSGDNRHQLLHPSANKYFAPQLAGGFVCDCSVLGAPALTITDGSIQNKPHCRLLFHLI